MTAKWEVGLEHLEWFHFASPAKRHQCNSPRRLGRGYSPQTKSHTHYSRPSLDKPALLESKRQIGLHFAHTLRQNVREQFCSG